jgi:CubicO group peptidase (beta-lactamase class C family)
MHCRLGLGAAALAVCFSAAGAPEVPLSGGQVDGFEALEQVVLTHMQRIGAPAATVAVGRGDALVYARGFGWADAARTRPVEPDALMRIASVTKPITAAAARKLIDEGRLRADDPVLARLALDDTPADRRWARIRVRHLIDHRGGWDAHQSVDPMFQVDAIARRLHLERPPRADDIVRYMLHEPLQFEPGARKAYSNFGYCVLGRVIERVAGTNYIDYVRQQLLGPYGIGDVRLGTMNNATRDAREVDYPNGASGFNTVTGDSAGGLVASAPALVRFLEHYWLGGAPRKPGTRGSWIVFGSLPGTSAMVRQLRSGVNYAVLMNARREGSHQRDQERLARRMDAAVERALQ